MTAAPATHEAYSPPTFRERVAALVGSSTWREPGGSRATGPAPLPAAHAVAAALAMVKRGAGDVGPDIAMCIALGSDAKRGLIVALLANAMKADRHPLTRRNVRTMGYVANCAFDIVVHGRWRERVDAISEHDWDLLLPSACRILEALADAALAEAERAWRRGGR